MIAATAPAQAVNLMDALTRQIARVAVIGERYSSLGGMPGVDVQPVIRSIDRALETAHEAAASGDPQTIIRSLRNLEGFEEWGTGKLWELKP
jgi:hypothetical protein